MYQRTDRITQHLEARRQRLVAEARGLVAAGGFGALRIGALATRAQVATGTVYRYFDGRDAIAVEVFRLVSQREVDAMAAALATHGIGHAIRTWIERAQAAPILAHALLYEPVCPDVEAARLEFRARYADQLALAIAADVAAGRLPPQAARISAACLVGALGESVLGPHGPAEPDAVVRFCLLALGTLEPS